MRAPGLTWFRLPLFIWAHYATSLIQVLGTPVIAITLLMIVFERGLGVGIFDPSLGGDPVLFQHLFWFYLRIDDVKLGRPFDRALFQLCIEGPDCCFDAAPIDVIACDPQCECTPVDGSRDD